MSRDEDASPSTPPDVCVLLDASRRPLESDSDARTAPSARDVDEQVQSAVSFGGGGSPSDPPLDELSRLLALVGLREPRRVPAVCLDRTSRSAIERVAARLAARARHAVVLRAEPADEGAAGLSKLGGAAWMAEDEAWPRCAQCGAPMAFLAQVDLGEACAAGVGAEASGVVPPVQGVLQVWCCNEGACDTYQPHNGTQSLRIVPKEEFSCWQPRAAEGRGTLPVKMVTGWTLRTELPNQEEFERSEQLERSEDVMRVYEWLENVEDTRFGQKVGGWPNWCQGVEYPACPECGDPMENVLLQLESEAVENVLFGDMGTAHATQCRNHANQLAFGWACC